MARWSYINRKIEKDIRPFLKRKEVISIVGPRQSGKTTLLAYLEKKLSPQKKVKFMTFENRADLNLFQNNIEDFKKLIQPYNCVIIDEFQYAEDGGQKLKYLFDTSKTKFFVSGSSSLELTFQTGKYMVGRMVDFILLPFSFREFLSVRDKDLFGLVNRKEFGDPINFKIKNGFGEELNRRLNQQLEEYLVYGGYPAVTLAESPEEKLKILESIEDKYLLRDIKSLLNLATEEELLKLERILAAQIGNIVKFEELSTVSGLSFKEMKKHLQILEKTYIISVVKPFFTNKRKELVKNPKVYFVDLGLRNYSLSDFRKLEKRNDLGSLSENQAYLSLRTAYPNIKLKYWRTKSKAEVDFVIEKDQRIYPVEVKYSSKKIVGKSFYSFIERFNPTVGLIITKDYLGQEKIKNTLVKFIPLSYL